MGLLESGDLKKGLNWNFGFDGWSRKIDPFHVWWFS